MNIQENSFDYHRESYIIIKNHKKSWKVIKGIFIYLHYFQHVMKMGLKRHLQKHRHKPLNDKYFPLFYMIVLASRISHRASFVKDYALPQ